MGAETDIIKHGADRRTYISVNHLACVKIKIKGGNSPLLFVFGCCEIK